MPKTTPEQNKAIVLEAFDTLFNKRDYAAAHDSGPIDTSGNGRPAAWIAADIVRFEDGKLAEHWDVLARRGNPRSVGQRATDVRRAVSGLRFGYLFQLGTRP
jgi:hypothetical protein